VIRRAFSSERAEVARTVAAAFASDPAWGWLLGAQYERLAPKFAGALFDLRVGSGNVWVSDDIATVAMWESPGGVDGSSEEPEQVWARYRAVAGEQAYQRLVNYSDGLAAVSPAEPYWYLGVLATHPARQREGLATAALEPVLEHADWTGLACCLETSTAPNRRFYEQRGFVESTDVPLPSGPPTWWLRRPAAARP
jgi:GNAT superfamily N-acetyltransferase